MSFWAGLHYLQGILIAQTLIVTKGITDVMKVPNSNSLAVSRECGG